MSLVRVQVGEYLNNQKQMDKERLKLIVRNLKQLVDALESEVHSDVDSYTNSHSFSSPDITYDEAWDDDDGYAD